MSQRTSHRTTQPRTTAPSLGLMARLRATRAARNDHRALASELSESDRQPTCWSCQPSSTATQRLRPYGFAAPSNGIPRAEAAVP